MKDLTEEDLREIRRRLVATTPGPWKSFIEGRDHQSGSDFVQTGGDDFEIAGATREDQDFIAHTREDVESLLNEVERLRSLLAGD